jgi:hypothetical protein
MPVTIDGTTGITTPAENTAALTVGAITGILKATSGVVSQAVAGTDYLVGGGSAITSTNTAKAWVNFNGTTGTITPRASYNVSSVTKNGTGDYTVNFTTAMSDANYAIIATQNGSVGSTSGNARSLIPLTLTTNSARVINIGAGSGEDGTIESVAIFGN